MDTNAHSLGDIRYPAQTIAVTEKGSGGPWLDAYFQLTSYPAYWSGNNSDGRFRTQRGKHNVFINSVYADGHAEASWGQPVEVGGLLRRLGEKRDGVRSTLLDKMPGAMKAQFRAQAESAAKP